MNPKLSTYISYQVSGYSMQSLDNVEIIWYDRKIYVPQGLHIHVLDWCHFYLNHSGGSRLAKTIREVYYWKGIFAQSELFAKPCKTCQQFKNRRIVFGHLPPKNISELKKLDLVHVDLIGPHSKSIRQKQPGSAIIRKNVSLTCMRIIDPAPGWLEIVEIPTFNLYDVMAGNDEYIDK